MFSDPYHLAQWWGPKGFTNRVDKLDFRTGGSWLHVMIGPDGKEYPTDNDILEVVPPERIVTVRPGDVVMTLGAGDIAMIGTEVLDLLRARETR